MRYQVVQSRSPVTAWASRYFPKSYRINQRWYQPLIYCSLEGLTQAIAAD